MKAIAALSLMLVLSVMLVSCKSSPPPGPVIPVATLPVPPTVPGPAATPAPASHDYVRDPVNPSVVGGVVAVVNGEYITKDEVLRALQTDFAKLDADASLTEAGRQAKRGELIQQRIRSEAERLLLLQEAKRKLTEQENARIDRDAQAYVNDFVRKAGSAEKAEKTLAAQGKSLEIRKKEELDNGRVYALLTREIGERNLFVRPRDMQAYYDSHRELYQRKQAVLIRQIFLRFDAYGDKTQARQKGEDILNRLAKGEDFGVLAKQYSDDPYAREGGLWPDFVEEGAGSLRPQVEDAAFRLPVKATSRLIESEIGYHVIRIEDVRAARLVPFAEVQQEIEQKLRAETLESRRKEFLDRLWKDSYIDVRWK